MSSKDDSPVSGGYTNQNQTDNILQKVKNYNFNSVFTDMKNL